MRSILVLLAILFSTVGFTQGFINSSLDGPEGATDAAKGWFIIEPTPDVTTIPCSQN
ncbi:MAG: hypothetical protein GQ574_18430 [Crocinitomix sp.]|nr:hypothetical protein [Crocinitomix sp.]